VGIKKHILKSNNHLELFALGIASSETEFQLTHILNSLADIHLSIAKPIISEGNNQVHTYACFKSENEENLQITLIKNKTAGVFLFQNQQAFDFILILSGSEAKKTQHNIQLHLKEQLNITLTSKLEIKQLRNLKKIISI
jgi:hypothetical protein